MVVPQNKKHRKTGLIFLVAFLVLISAGIIAKRMFLHPDLVVFFHLPGAVCFVLTWYYLSYEIRKKYRQSIRDWRTSEQGLR